MHNAVKFSVLVWYFLISDGYFYSLETELNTMLGIAEKICLWIQLMRCKVYNENWNFFCISVHDCGIPRKTITIL